MIPYPAIHELAREREDEIRKETTMLHSYPAQQPGLFARLAGLFRRAGRPTAPAAQPPECADSASVEYVRTL